MVLFLKHGAEKAAPVARNYCVELPAMPNSSQLSRRERQIMDLIYEMSEASAKDILAALPNPPSYSAIRATVNKLEKKGYLAHREQDLKYIYFPTIDHEEARVSAIQRLLKIFFGGSTSQAVTAMLNLNMNEISTEDLEELDAMIDRARIEKTRTTNLRRAT
jgi:BlaI family penicillinase repressor